MSENADTPNTNPPATEPDGSPAPAEAVASPQANFEGVDFSGCCVLIVDDNAQNVELLQAYLEGLDCRLVTASDGIEAMSIIEGDEDLPDLVVLDVMMPRMSGFEVCRKIKEDPATRDVPVIMVTALNEIGDYERGVEAGTDDFLTKPVQKLELVTRVKSLLRYRMLQQELEQSRGETSE